MKNFGVGLLCSLLFFSLLVFGVLYTVNSTVLNPKFVVDRIEEIGITELIDEVVEIEEPQDSGEVTGLIRELTPKIEPLVKERTEVAVNSVYDYLLEKRQQPEMRSVVRDSFLNPGFVDSLLKEISIPELVDIMLRSNSSDGNMTEAFVTAVTSTVSETESELKGHITTIASHVFDYILRDSQAVDLRGTLRETILSHDFVVLLMDELKLVDSVSDVISVELRNSIPSDMSYLAAYIPGTVESLEPTIEARLTEAIDPFLDYLLGTIAHFRISIPIDPVIETLEEELLAEFLASPPSQLAGLSRAELIQLYNTEIKGNVAGFLPSSIVVDETMLGQDIAGGFSEFIVNTENSLSETRQTVDEAITEIEERLVETKSYVSIFRIAFFGFIALIILSVAGVILVLRDVKAVTRRLGIPLFTYGIFEYGGVWAGRFLFENVLPEADIPAGLQTWVLDMAEALIKPLEIFSLVLLITGLILILISLFYKRSAGTKPVTGEPTVKNPENPPA